MARDEYPSSICLQQRKGKKDLCSQGLADFRACRVLFNRMILMQPFQFPCSLQGEDRRVRERENVSLYKGLHAIDRTEETEHHQQMRWEGRESRRIRRGCPPQAHVCKVF